MVDVLARRTDCAINYCVWYNIVLYLVSAGSIRRKSLQGFRLAGLFAGQSLCGYLWDISQCYKSFVWSLTQAERTILSIIFSREQRRKHAGALIAENLNCPSPFYITVDLARLSSCIAEKIEPNFV